MLKVYVDTNVILQGIQQIFSFDEHFDRIAEIQRLKPGS